MQLALYGSVGWRHHAGISQVIRWAQEHGWDAVDARGITLDIPGDDRKRFGAFGYDMIGPRHLRPSARKALRREFEEAETPLLCLYCASPVNLAGELGDDCRARFFEFVELAAELGCPWVRAINNTTQSFAEKPFTPSEAFERTVEGLSGIVPRAADLGVGILIENNENTTTSSPAELAQMQDALAGAGRVGIAYDGVNAYFQGHDPLEGMRELAGRIDVLHLKNVRRHEDSSFAYLPRGNYSYEWTSLESGDLDWRLLLTTAHQQGFDGPLTFEYVNPFKGMPLDYWTILREPDEAAAVEATYLRQLVSEITEA